MVDKSETNANLDYWNKFNQPPTEALKEIKAGRLKGKTDINPQWRLKAMTEVFGACGVGWYYEVVNKWAEPTSADQVFAFADINLYIKVGDEWSKPIPGHGGSMLVTKESIGLHVSDEGFKMAITDALSVAMKQLGMAGDIYMGMFDGSKYSQPAPEAKAPAQPAPAPSPTAPPTPVTTPSEPSSQGGNSDPQVPTPESEASTNPLVQTALEFGATFVEHQCPLHGVEFFKKGKMKNFAHPIMLPDGNKLTNEDGKDVWCNEDTTTAGRPSRNAMISEGGTLLSVIAQDWVAGEAIVEDFKMWLINNGIEGEVKTAPDGAVYHWVKGLYERMNFANQPVAGSSDSLF